MGRTHWIFKWSYERVEREELTNKRGSESLFTYARFRWPVEYVHAMATHTSKERREEATWRTVSPLLSAYNSRKTFGRRGISDRYSTKTRGKRPRDVSALVLCTTYIYLYYKCVWKRNARSIASSRRKSYAVTPNMAILFKMLLFVMLFHCIASYHRFLPSCQCFCVFVFVFVFVLVLVFFPHLSWSKKIHSSLFALHFFFISAAGKLVVRPPRGPRGRKEEHTGSFKIWTRLNLFIIKANPIQSQYHRRTILIARIATIRLTMTRRLLKRGKKNGIQIFLFTLDF